MINPSCRFLLRSALNNVPISHHRWCGARAHNGATTSYLLDLGAGPMLVLSDRTNIYLYGNPSTGSGQAQRLAQYQAEMQYFGADGLGSVRQLYDTSGMLIMTERYDPYGNLMSQSARATSVFGFTGEQNKANGR